MNIVFVSVVLNIHQVGVADELYKLTNGNFRFIQTSAAPCANSKGGTTDFSTRPYVVISNETNHSAIMQLINEADVVIHGAAPISLLTERAKAGKLIFIYSERWLKRGLINLLSPRLMQQQLFYHLHCHNKPVYALCASAYAASDFKLMHSFNGKCFKWGYFTPVPELDIDEILSSRQSCQRIRILWVARFIHWKHPEVMVSLAKSLHSKGYDVTIDMIGKGEPLKTSVKQLVSDNGIDGIVNFPDSMPNEDLIVRMRDYHIFCFTSDRNEGWGAVLGEAMAAGCCPVASVECGATPYLVQDGENGLIFNPSNTNDLEKKVQWLIDHPKERTHMSRSAYETMRLIWNPVNAAKNLYQLSSAILSGETSPITDGPCSKA